MRRGSLERIYTHIDYILVRHGRQLLLLAVAVAVLSVYSALNPQFYQATVIGFSMLLPLLAAGIASTGPAAELSRGETQVYLAEGLTRAEYLASWLAVLSLYTAAAVDLTIVVPAAIIDPVALTESVVRDALVYSTLACIAYGSLAAMYAAIIARPGAVSGAVLIHTLAAPVAAAMYAGLAGAEPEAIVYLVAPLNPVTVYVAKLAGVAFNEPLAAAETLAATLAYTLGAWAAAKRREV